MSFFPEVPPVEPEPEPEIEPERPQPEWFGPATTVLPEQIVGRLLMFKTDKVALVIDRFRVYPNGVVFTATGLMRNAQRGGGPPPWMPWERGGRWGPSDPDRLLRLGVSYSDGSKWTNVDDLADGGVLHRLDTPPVPSLTPQGGSMSDRAFDSDYWLWPLPPAGPVTFVVAWPAFGIDETEQQLDGSLIRDASARAVHLWDS